MQGNIQLRGRVPALAVVVGPILHPGFLEISSTFDRLFLLLR